jgi:YegS/Rv2252/BmrU family lipid kinase
MTSVAVVAHAGKTIGGGLDELRAVLAHAGVDTPLWYEVPKSKKAPPKVEEAVEAGADLLLVWGGDGMVQRCVDALRNPDVAVGIVPAGTANLLATHLGIPQDIEAAVDIALHGRRRAFDLGEINGERFGVMAGAGFDARMIRDADKKLKGKAGKAAYVWTGARNIGSDPVPTRVKVDGATWFEGDASCVLVGNVGTVIGGLPAFPDAVDDDGVLEVGVVTAESRTEWARVLGRLATGSPEKSPLTRMTAGRRIRVRMETKVPYELDGGDRSKTKRLKVDARPGALTVCVPEGTTA